MFPKSWKTGTGLGDQEYYPYLLPIFLIEMWGKAQEADFGFLLEIILYMKLLHVS